MKLRYFLFVAMLGCGADAERVHDLPDAGFRIVLPADYKEMPAADRERIYDRGAEAMAEETGFSQDALRSASPEPVLVLQKDAGHRVIVTRDEVQYASIADYEIEREAMFGLVSDMYTDLARGEPVQSNRQSIAIDGVQFEHLRVAIPMNDDYLRLYLYEAYHKEAVLTFTLVCVVESECSALEEGMQAARIY